MNSHREFREIVKTCREGSTQQPLFPKLFGTLRLFILFLIFSNNAFSQNIQNQQYDINDPRNPNCPCHKLQQIADDEYNKIQNDDNQQQFASNLNVKISNKNNIDNNINRQDNNFNPRQINFIQVDNVGNDNSSQQIKRDFSPNRIVSPVEFVSSGTKIKKKNSGLWLRKKIYRAKIKHSRIKKVRPNYAVCYKW